MKSIDAVPQGNVGGKNRYKALAVTQHLILSLVGSFASTWGFVAVGVAGLVALGIDYHEAETTLLLLAFLIFLSLFLWSFAASRRWWVIVLLFSSAAIMTFTAWALQRAVLA